MFFAIWEKFRSNFDIFGIYTQVLDNFIMIFFLVKLQRKQKIYYISWIYINNYLCVTRII